MNYRTPEILKAQLEAIEPNHFREGSFDDLTYRAKVAEMAERYNSELARDGQEWADKWLRWFLPMRTEYKKLGLLERMKEQVLQHATYLRAQEATNKALNDLVLGKST